MQKILLSLASLLLVVLGVVIGQGLDEAKFRGSTFSTTSPAADDATAAYDLNALSTDNVYQQQVVNGWGARDMLEVIANQTDGLDQMAGSISEDLNAMASANAQSQQVQIQLQLVQIVLIGILIGSVILLMPKKQRASPTVRP